MARVRYVGWESREPSRRDDRVTSFPAQLKHSVSLPKDGGRLVFRGRAGSPSQWRTVDDRYVDLFLDAEDFEVRE